MAKFWALIEVLYQGRQLANPAKWKNAQTLLNTSGGGGGLLVLLDALSKLLPENAQLTSADIYQIGEAVAIIGVTGVNAYLTNATSDKVGIKPRNR